MFTAKHSGASPMMAVPSAFRPKPKPVFATATWMAGSWMIAACLKRGGGKRSRGGYSSLLSFRLIQQFRSFVDPFIILLALPPGISGVLLTLVLTGTTLNIMSLMGVVMLAGIAMSNSILIVE